AAGVPGLRAVPDRPRLGTGRDGSVRAMPDGFAAHEPPQLRPHHRAHPHSFCLAGRDVLDDVDERRNLRHQAQSRSVLGTRGAGSPEHGRARRGDRVRDRPGAAHQACRHALCVDPIARKVPAQSSASNFAWDERLRPWSMLEVFVFGVFVAYVKLGDLVTIGLAAGVYALLALTFVLIWMDSALDREAVWEGLYRANLCGGTPILA